MQQPSGLTGHHVAFAVLLIPVGFMRGFIAGALALGGFALGAFAGARLAPLLLDSGSDSPYTAMFTLVGAALLGAILAGLLEALGTSVQTRMPGVLGIFDGVLGAGLTTVLALGLAWLAARRRPARGASRQPRKQSG